MIPQSALARIHAEYDHATTKWPVFADRFLSPYTTDKDIIGEVNIARHRSDAECDRHYWSVEATLREEVAEVMEAAMKLDWANCKQELAQVATVAIRAMEWIDKEILNGNKD